MSAITDVVVRSLHGGVQTIIFFENGYGASIVQHSGSYGHQDGLFEIAVLIGNKDEFDLCYTTEITNDVLGYLNNEDVAETIERIREL